MQLDSVRARPTCGHHGVALRSATDASRASGCLFRLQPGLVKESQDFGRYLAKLGNWSTFGWKYDVSDFLCQSACSEEPRTLDSVGCQIRADRLGIGPPSELAEHRLATLRGVPPRLRRPPQIARYDSRRSRTTRACWSGSFRAATTLPLLSHPLLLQNLPHPIRPDRNLHVRHAQVGQRVHHRVCDRRRRPYRSRLTHALGAQRVVR